MYCQLRGCAACGRIRAAREAQGLSERELACRLGLKAGTVTAWETVLLWGGLYPDSALRRLGGP
jgi:ribosome-binding protein aMBF1 (putative translation factor)